MEHKKQKLKIHWVLLLASAPIVISALLWFAFQRAKPGAFLARFYSPTTSVYRGYPLVTNANQSNHLEKTKHKVAMRQPFYLDPIRHDPKKVVALVAFLSSGWNHDPETAAKACVFHADLLLEIGGFPFGSQALVCTSCGDVWIGATDVRDSTIAIKQEKIPELKELVSNILGKPAEWPPELQE